MQVKQSLLETLLRLLEDVSLTTERNLAERNQAKIEVRPISFPLLTGNSHFCSLVCICISMMRKVLHWLKRAYQKQANKPSVICTRSEMN